MTRDMEKANFSNNLINRIVKFSEIIGAAAPMYGSVDYAVSNLESIAAIRFSETVWLYRFTFSDGTSESRSFDITSQLDAFINKRFQATVFLTQHAEHNLLLSFDDGLLIDVKKGHHICVKV